MRLKRFNIICILNH